MVSGKMYKDLGEDIRQKISNMKGGEEIYERSISIRHYYAKNEFIFAIEKFQLPILGMLRCLFTTPRKKFRFDKIILSHAYYLKTISR